VYTIGHSNVTVDKIVQLLQKYRIEVLVDVRSVPHSHYSPQFNRGSLAEALQESGIEYLFAGKFLGGRPEDPSCYKSNDVPVSREEYLDLVDYDRVAKQDWYQNAITRLIEIARDRRTVVMCSEEDPKQCHRYRLIGQTLINIGLTVWHIRGRGVLEQQVSLNIFQGEQSE
jgi:uncharacterized protein (DUF488 family)